MNRKLRVYAYITRLHNAQLQVLVFDHVDAPEAGTQVPVVREMGVMEMAVPLRNELQERHFFHLTTDRALPEEWVHVVSSGTEDAGMRFRYFWLDANQAASLLAGEQGRCLLGFQ